MTVDMLAATFFWPEGTVLGAPLHPPGEAEPAHASADDPETADRAAAQGDLWSAMRRHLWRRAPAEPVVTGP